MPRAANLKHRGKICYQDFPKLNARKKSDMVHTKIACARTNEGLVLQELLWLLTRVSLLFHLCLSCSSTPGARRSRKKAFCPKRNNLSLTKAHVQECTLQHKVVGQICATSTCAAASAHSYTSGCGHWGPNSHICLCCPATELRVNIIYRSTPH